MEVGESLVSWMHAMRMLCLWRKLRSCWREFRIPLILIWRKWPRGWGDGELVEGALEGGGGVAGGGGVVALTATQAEQCQVLVCCLARVSPLQRAWTHFRQPLHLYDTPCHVTLEPQTPQGWVGPGLGHWPERRSIRIRGDAWMLPGKGRSLGSCKLRPGEKVVG